MQRPLILRAALATTACAMALAGTADATTVAPAGTHANTGSGYGGGDIGIATGADGSAMLTWTSTGVDSQVLQLSDLAPSGAFGPVQTILDSPVLDRIPFSAVGADGSAMIIAARGAAQAPDQVVALRRAQVGQAFGPPQLLANETYISVLAAASDPHGDVALVVSHTGRHAELLIAPEGAGFGAPQDVSPDNGRVASPAVAIDSDGHVVVAYYDTVSRTYARSGTINGALSAPQLLGKTRNYPAIDAAIDDAGDATVAFSRSLPKNSIGIAVARAKSGQPFGKVVNLDSGPNAQQPRLAAAGSTTAITWQRLTSSNSVEVAIAHGIGKFAAAQSPATPATHLHGYAGRYGSTSGFAEIAVDKAGDVLLAYPYGFYSASVHAVMRRAGDTHFGSPHVISAIGRGGTPSVALLADGRPLIAYSDGDAVLASTTLNHPRPDLTPPTVTETPLSASELRSKGTVSTTVRCSATCFVGSQARITTGVFHTGVGQVISRQGRNPVVLAAGHSLKLTYALSAKGRTALAQSGRAQIKVIVTETNASGAGRSMRRELNLHK